MIPIKVFVPDLGQASLAQTLPEPALTSETETETPPSPPPTTPYERIGGRAVLEAIVNRFYDLMDEDPTYAELRAMHGPDLGPMRESLTGFFTGWAGGPRDWFAGGKCVMSLHRPLAITPATARQWLEAMRRAIDESVGAQDPEIARAMLDVLKQMTAGMAGGARH